MADRKRGAYPANDDRSLGYQAARTAVDAATGLTAIPGLGYLAGTMMDHLVGPPLQARRDRFLKLLGEDVDELQEKFGDFDPSNLSENEDFVSAVYEATIAAMKTAKADKLEALRNGALNIAIGMSLDEVIRGAFFSYVERFSTGHLRVLRVLSNPSDYPAMVAKADAMNAGSQGAVLRAEVPETEISEPILKRVLSDLTGEGLLDSASMSAMGSKGVFLLKRTTEIGDAFLRFIEKPSP